MAQVVFEEGEGGETEEVGLKDAAIEQHHWRTLNRDAKVGRHDKEIPALGELAYFRVFLRWHGREELLDLAAEFLQALEKEQQVPGEYFAFLADDLMAIAMDASVLAKVARRIGKERGGQPQPRKL